MASNQSHYGLDWLIGELDARKAVLDEAAVRRLLTQANFDWAEVAPYVEERADTCVRRCVVRREYYEVLVLTWSPLQGSAAHDHSGSLCGLKVVRGCLTEQLFEGAPDGRVRKTSATRISAEGITVDSGLVIHSLLTVRRMKCWATSIHSHRCRRSGGTPSPKI